MRIFILLIALLTGCQSPGNSECPNPLVDENAEIVITRIIDGDTYEFQIKDEKFGIRLLGVDCFETRRGSRLTKQADHAGISEDSALVIGKAAKLFASEFLLQQRVQIVRDSIASNMDNYGRFLRHVFRDATNMADTLRSLKFVAGE